MKTGLTSATVVEPQGLAVIREYKIPWKKQSLNIAELARMRFKEGLSFRDISKKLKAPRTTVIETLQRLERNKGATWDQS